MIALVRPDGHDVYVNPDLIETAERDEERGMTLIVLTTGNTLVVRESASDIATKVISFRVACRADKK